MELRLPKDFKEFLRLLHYHGVEYLLIGGYAVGYYGYPRATLDIDIWIRAESINAGRVVTCLDEFGFGDASLSHELFMTPGHVIRMGMPPMRIELLTSISGVEFDDCYLNRVTAQIDDVDVSLISLSDLKRNKKASGRHKDLDDLDNLS